MLEVRHIVGLDLGQVNDFTALVSLRREQEVPEPPKPKVVDPETQGWEEILNPPRPDIAAKQPSKYYCNIAERFERGSAYPDLAKKICKLFQDPKFAGETLVIDGTGVGRGVVDIFRDARPNCHLMPITITGGVRALGATSVDDKGYWHVPKKELVSSVQVLLSAARLEVAPSLKHAAVLVNELKAFTYKINSGSGHVTYEAWREKDHDDLVLALAMAAWCGEKAKQQLWVR